MPPFRADHVGSLLRPPALLAARAAHAAGEIDVTWFTGSNETTLRLSQDADLQGRSFQAFYDFLLSPQRQAELTELNRASASRNRLLTSSISHGRSSRVSWSH